VKTENKEQQTLPQDGSRNGRAEKDKWLDDAIEAEGAGGKAGSPQ